MPRCSPCSCPSLNVKHLEGALAYRLDGAAMDRTQHLAIRDIAAGQFVKLWQAGSRREVGVPTRAYSFRRPFPGSAALQVSPQRGRPTARQEITFTGQPPLTDVSAQIGR